MERHVMADLAAWRTSPYRKPLVLEGARQVGKTWCLKQLGERYYDNIAYINFEATPSLASIFDGDLDVRQIVAGLSAATGVPIEPGKTLIILDEVQDVPRAVTSLKYFAEQAPQQHVVAAGSLLGVALHKGASFPVGKVDFLTVRPLTFAEFAQAVGQGSLIAALADGDWPVINALHDRYVTILRDYLCVGGMPEAVARFADARDFVGARQVQQSVINAYERDFSKHAPIDEVPRIADVWRSLPSQLAKANGRFIYGDVTPGARGRQYEAAILWLKQAGLIHVVRQLTAPRLPLAAYEDKAIFKLFAVDTGLLVAMSGLDVSAVTQGNRLFTEFKGTLTEQYACQELVALMGRAPHYWMSGPGGAEIDFVAQLANDIVPIEVKAERNLRAKSLQVYRAKYDPPVAVRMSLMPHTVHECLIDLPLYAAGRLNDAVRPTGRK
ncbi:MAG: ATP-binding protein [Propionibacteriaceae bacterium]|nr:ATP-binding protein [Propionibacteriaceae bacterium]